MAFVGHRAANVVESFEYLQTCGNILKTYKLKLKHLS